MSFSPPSSVRDMFSVRWIFSELRMEIRTETAVCKVSVIVVRLTAILAKLSFIIFLENPFIGHLHAGRQRNKRGKVAVDNYATLQGLTIVFS
jgi:hypothetical protein